jgi:hypothetical protein
VTRLRFGTFALVALATSFLLAWALRRDDAPTGPCVVATGPASLPEVVEASGLAVSRRTPGVLWSHNDSGNAAVLFALDRTGAVRGRVHLPVRTSDWEDVSAAPCPGGDCLYIADIGDNFFARRSVRIYRVPEPSPGDARTAPPELFTATYADGRHNAEALFVVGTDLYIVTKDRVGGVYRATMTADHALTFQRIGELGLLTVTDAETSADGMWVAVRTSDEVVVYRTVDLTGGNAVPALRVPLDGFGEVQGEGVALDGDLLFLASEGRPWTGGGSVVSLRCSGSSVMPIKSLNQSKN